MVITATRHSIRFFSVFFNRACLYSLNNEFTAAFEDLKKAAQADPHSTLASLGDPQLDALVAEDTYLAGSMLMLLSLLGVVGTLVSDLLLLWLDPRIRLGAAAS